MSNKQIYILISIALIVTSGFVWAIKDQTSQGFLVSSGEIATGDGDKFSFEHNRDVKRTGVSLRESSEVSLPNPVDPALETCLTNPGPLITLSGSMTYYKDDSLAEKTKIDASMASFENGGEHPVNIGGGTDVCWYSGKIYGGYPPETSWETTHPTAGIQIYDGTYRSVIEGVYIDQIGDGIKVRYGEDSGQAGITEPFIVRGVWLRDIRDDCIESDWQAGAIIEDSLLDGCYVIFATEKRPSASTNGSNNTWEIRDTLAYMHDQIGVYKGPSPGHGMFFKWDDTSPQWKMYDSILRVDSTSGQSSDQFDFRLDKLADCENNILVWLGPGAFPGTVPDCFTITKDRSIWDNAVRVWKIRHGFISQEDTFRIYSPLLLRSKLVN